MNIDLTGYRVLVVEDDFHLAFEIGDILEETGITVIGPVGHLEEALQTILGNKFDIVSLDINLHGILSFPAADMLVELRKPFFFTTAYDDAILPERYKGHPVLSKPFRSASLISKVGELARAQ